ncbi:MAG: glycoside hydrolase family 127 protein [Planctomycetes bacterium]|nr:glycoside hydrolase family 127 protein [Planctomycetota bacterium]
MRNGLATRVLAIVVACAAAAAQDPAPAAPGNLALELRVVERSGVARAGAVVTSGVPFPPGFLADPACLAVLDGAGRPVLAQASVLSRWWAPAHDDSVRWVAVSFPADVRANGHARYTLVDRPLTEAEAARLPRLRAGVTESDDDWVVSTGVARFFVPKKGAMLVRRAEVGGVDLLGADGIRVLATGGDWPEEGMRTGGLHFGLHARVDVEEQGPVRVVLAVHGAFRGQGPGTFGGGDLYDFTARLSFDVGSAGLRVVHTMRNGRLGAELRVWPVEDLSLLVHFQPGDHPGALLLGQNDAVPVDLAQAQVASLYQDSSGGPEWKELTSRRNYAAWLAAYTKTPKEGGGPGDARYFVRGASFPGYELRSDETVLERGAVARGAIFASGARGGVLVAMRHFRVRCPSALTVTRGAVRAGLWPGEYAEPLFLEPGQRFTRELALDFRLGAAGSADLRQAHAVLDRRLLFRAPPEWYVASGAWDAGLGESASPGVQGGPGIAARGGLDKDRLDGIDVGWDWFGWITGWNAGGAHWNQSSCFSGWVLREDALEFDTAEARTLWASDVTPLHFDRCDLARYWMVLRGWRWADCGIAVKVFPERAAGYDWKGRAVWGNPDDGHMGMFMWLEYYHLTADRRVLESCLALGERARAYMWSHNHDDVRTGGAGGSSVPWCRRRDPDDPTFRLHNRYTGWPLYNLALYYQLTGDAQVAAEAANIAAGLRNTARWAPQGFLTTNVVDAGNKGGTYANQLATGDPPADCASQCYAHFQVGVCATALVQYYRETKDEDALDVLIGIADFYTHHALVRDAGGRAHGWSYVFGDYWGPYRREDFLEPWRPNWAAQNFRVVQPLGWIQMLTGRADYRDLLRTALAGVRQTDRRLLAAHQALAAPARDETPPAAVADLAAEPLGGGQVRLTWSAPGDNGTEGRAARYQVKKSSSPIVERIAGWPDRTPPLPRTAAEWEARAGGFHAGQRAFWAAENVAGEPRPGAAGTRETFEVGGLRPGVWHFALKTWDDGPNMSALSNVVRVEVR